MKVPQRHQALYDHAVEVSGEYLTKEIEVFCALEDIEREKTYLYFDAKNLFVLANKNLKLTESAAYAFSSVARRAVDLPQLSKAVRTGEISIYTATRMLVILCKQNADDLIEFAKTHTQRELDFEVARRNPKKKKRSTAKPVNENTVRFAADIKKSTHEKLKRAQALMSAKRFVDFDVVIEKAVDEWLERHDPIIQADRAKPSQKDNSQNTSKNVPAAEEHARNKRDRGQCTYVDANGVRCCETWWTEAHHIKHRKDGGTNDHSNLTTLCSYHHKMVHQYDLPLDGHISWMKEPTVTWRKSLLRENVEPLRRVQ